jgi:hypothetical protein
VADPRRTSSRRAALSYDQLKRLTDEAGFRWPDLLIKDYQGIIQDTTFLSDEVDDLELRVVQNEEDIEVLQAEVLDLQERVEDLEYRVFETILTTASLTAEEFQTIICRNTSPIEILLKTLPLKDDEINIKRKPEAASVKVIGEIDGETFKVLNVRNYSMKLVFDGIEWSEI